MSRKNSDFNWLTATEKECWAKSFELIERKVKIKQKLNVLYLKEKTEKVELKIDRLEYEIETLDMAIDLLS